MKTKLFKRMTAFAAASVLAVSAAVSSLAASNIYIKPNDHTNTGKEDRYNAYQIFNGVVDTSVGKVDHANPTHYATSLTQEGYEEKYAEELKSGFEAHIENLASDKAAFAALDGTDPDEGEAAEADGKVVIRGKEYLVDADHLDDSYKEFLVDEELAYYAEQYEKYVEEWEVSHTMTDINWGSAFFGFDYDNKYKAGTLEDADFVLVGDLLKTLATTDWDGKDDGDKHTWDVSGNVLTHPVTEKGNGDDLEAATLIEAAFAEIYAEYLASMSAAEDLPAENDEEKIVKNEAYNALSKASANKVAKVLAGIYEFGRIDETNQFHFPDSYPRLNQMSDGNVPVIGERGVTTEILQKFAGIVANKDLKNEIPSEWANEAAYTEGDDAITAQRDGWIIKDAPPGYYLIVDTTEEIEKGDAITPYFLDVAAGADVVVFVKSNAPTVDKKITGVEDKSDKVTANGETAVAAIGDKISYELKGTLPENFGDFYDSYYYRFVDVMSKGLTLDQASVKVTVDVPDHDTLTAYENLQITESFKDVLNADGKKNFSVKVDKDDETAGKTEFYVTFTDLRTALFKALEKRDEITEEQFKAIDWNNAEVKVTYTAVLNKDAEIRPASSSGNENTVHITYTNNPNVDGKGDKRYDPDKEDPDDPEKPDDKTKTKTKEKSTTVYTFEVDITKKNDEGDTLAGAEFKVIKGGEKAVFYKTGDGEYVLIGWTSDSNDFDWDGFVTKNLDDLKAVLGLEDTAGADDIKEKLIYEEKAESEDSNTEGSAKTKNVFVAAITGANGKLNIKGLTEGKYTFDETKAPHGYKSAKTFDVELVAEFDENGTEAPHMHDAVPEELYETLGIEEETTWSACIANDPAAKEYYDELVKLMHEDDKYNGMLHIDSCADGVEDCDHPLYDPEGTSVDYTGKVTAANAILTNAVKDQTGVANIDVFDPAASLLPGTGGMGVYLFYIAGGLLVALAVAGLVYTKKKKNTNA